MASVEFRLGGLTKDAVEKMAKKHAVTIEQEHTHADHKLLGSSTPEFSVRMDESMVHKLLAESGVVMVACRAQ